VFSALSKATYNKVKQITSYILRLLVGGLFVFSVFIKLIDPKGTQIKLEEYFTAFSRLGTHYIGSWFGSIFEALHPFAIYLSIGLSALEVILGIGLLIWYRPKLFTSITILLLIFFGFLTGYSAQCNPYNELGVSCVTDCGCFGDFLKLKPIESFYKDLILLILTLPLFFFSRKDNSKPRKWQGYTFYTSIVLGIGFGLFNLINEPIIDFRPYKVGNNILEKMNDGTPAKIAYVMSKNGQEETLEVYPESSEYSFVRVEEIEAEKPASIHDFYLFDENGEDITNTILSKENTFIVFKNIEDLDTKDLENLAKQLEVNPKSIILSGSNKEKITTTLSKKVNVYNLDETVLKAIVRNYPSVMSIKEGVVLRKEAIEDFLKNGQ
jgi:hypothetical protein